MKNKNAKIIIRVICFFIIGIILFCIVTNIMIPKWITTTDNRMTYIIQGFYEEPKDSLDVIFMGNSDVYRGISPIKMWDEYGIASYNFVSSGQRMWVAYYMLEECLKYQNPDLIVLNMDSAFNESDASESNYRKAFDNMKFGKNKINAVTDPVFKNTEEQKFSYFFPITRYHSRWSELTEADFNKALKREKFAYKGMDMITDIVPNNDGYKYMERDHSKEVIGEKCSKYLEKIINLCKEKEINLLLIEIPSAESWSKDLSDKTFEYAKEKNLEFIDMNLNGDEFGFNWKKDTCDGGDHLNVYGAEKVSKYLGKIIQEKYNIPNRKDDPNYSSWKEASKKYHKDKKKMEKESKNK